MLINSSIYLLCLVLYYDSMISIILDIVSIYYYYERYITLLQTLER